MTEVKSTAELHALEACRKKTFHSINLVDVKDKIASMLSMIGRDGIFSEYTKHSIEHVDGMLVLMDIIIPKGEIDFRRMASFSSGILFP